MGEVLLPVSVEEKTLNITLSPDKPMDTGGYYHPRDVARYDILVTDNTGAPVEAELSLRLADLSVLALADEVGTHLAAAVLEPARSRRTHQHSPRHRYGGV